MRAVTARRIIVAPSITALVGGVAAWFLPPLVPFRVVYHDGTGRHRLIERTIDADESVVLRSTLERYRERFATRGGRVFVTAGLHADRELRWNYSRKAGLFE